MAEKTKQPLEMYLLAITAMCQRFAFWGIGYLLVIYLVQFKNFTDMDADHLFGIFTGAAFVLPVLGGYIADRMNYRLPVIWGMISTAIGCFLMATGYLPLIYLALIFTAVGGAIFTPSIYAILGNVYRHKHHLRDGGFTIYYAMFNFGVFISLIILGALGQAKLWNIAYIFAGIVQLVGLIPFAKVLKNPDVMRLSSPKLPSKQQKEAPLHPHEKARIVVILVLSLFSIIFWMAYNQSGSSMNLFALRFTDRHVLGFTMPPSWLLSSENLYQIILVFPLAALYHFLAKRKLDPSPITKSALSLIILGLCFFIMAYGSGHIPPGAQSASLSPWYLLSAYALMSFGEMLICPIGLSLITHLSPHRFTALLVGVWYLCIGIGFYLGGVLAGLMSFLPSLSQFFNIFVVITFISGIILLFVSKKLSQMRHLESL